MKKKLKSQSGLTLLEMVAGMLILSLLCMMLGTGFALAQKTYKSVTSQSEMQLLTSTVSDVLYNEFRYAKDIQTDANNNLVSYTSPSFGENTMIKIENGQLEANGGRMLATGAYGKGVYGVSGLQVTYKNNVFNVTLTIKDNENSNEEQNKFNVRCLI